MLILHDYLRHVKTCAEITKSVTIPLEFGPWLTVAGATNLWIKSEAARRVMGSQWWGYGTRQILLSVSRILSIVCDNLA